MFSFVKKIVSSVVPWRSETPINDFYEQEQYIFDRIKNLRTDFGQTSEEVTNLQEKPCGLSDPLQRDVETVKCVHKTGRVTHLCDEYGLIDNVFHFELNQVSAGLIVNTNDEVLYSAYKLRENEAERVYKVYALKNDTWESGDGSVTEYLLPDAKKVEEIPALTRVITGRVTQRKGREVFIDSGNIWCDLDEIQAEYVPVEGDWVELKAVVSVCKETADLSGDILEVKSLKPLLKKTGFGRVTFWSDTKREGAIENLIFFTNVSCEGYIPALGDEVIYNAVESDQERFKWRAVSVLIRNVKLKEKPIINDNSINVSSPFSNKNGISVVPFECIVEVELNQSKTVQFEVTNNGTVKQLLKFTKFNLKRNSQLVLLSPKHSGPVFIHPKETILFQFQCNGKYLGLSGEIFYLYFKGFVIAKRFEIKVVGSGEMNKLLECKFESVLKICEDRKFIKSDVNADVVLYGPKPWKPPKFVSRERKCAFKIPKKLCGIMTGSAQAGKNLELLLQYAPYLHLELNFDHYADRFHTLLYLEEIELKLNFRKFDMNGVFLQREDEYFVLEVPGLAEGRPSLVIGDKIVLTQPWAKGGKIKHVGYVHCILAKKVLLKFHKTFHENYDETECDVVFEPSTSFFSRCHDAVNRSTKNLGADWLFPSAVNEKLPQVDFEVSPHDTKDDLYSLPGLPCRRSLVWVNGSLNERQKLAVVSVLEGKGRPLPYIIFGPPGTGKTATLVEIVIQIYRLMPESRILVATPANSSADLICERLIEFGNFKPGQLVRLVARYRVCDELVPAKLIPYSTFLDRKESAGRNSSKASLRNDIRSSSFGEVAGRHRITVATCASVGVLHYLGFPPGHFTHILVDEAGQTSEPEALISTTFQNIQSGQVILSGDPLQLGPVVRSNAAKSLGLGVSLLERLMSTFPYARDFDGFRDHSGFDPRFITKLNVNYRTVPEILSLPSQLFYNSDLIPTVSQTAGEEAKIIKSFNFEAENRETPPAIIFHGVVGQNYREKDSPSWFNPHEIWQALFYVRKLYSLGLKDDDIGIVSPYTKQVQKLKSLLTSLDLSAPKIGSVEEFQGQERRVIIVTTVRSSYKYVNSDIVHSLGFVASPQRLNVALTRARALLVIIGNPFLLSKDPYWINVVEYCLKNGSYTGCSLDPLSENSKVEVSAPRNQRKKKKRSQS